MAATSEVAREQVNEVRREVMNNEKFPIVDETFARKTLMNE
jgi:hypothetical protein